MLLTKVKAATTFGPRGKGRTTVERRTWPLRRSTFGQLTLPAAPPEEPLELPEEVAECARPRRWRRVALVAATLCVALIVGVGTAAFANDAFTRERLLRGTRIGGVAIGGDTVAQAERKLTERFVAPLKQPLVI